MTPNPVAEWGTGRDLEENPGAPGPDGVPLEASPAWRSQSHAHLGNAKNRPNRAPTNQNHRAHRAKPRPNNAPPPTAIQPLLPPKIPPQKKNPHPLNPHPSPSASPSPRTPQPHPSNPQPSLTQTISLHISLFSNPFSMELCRRSLYLQLKNEPSLPILTQCYHPSLTLGPPIHWVP